MPQRKHATESKRESSSGARVAKQQRSRETQQKILRSALGVFAERGYDGASINLVAERAGVGQPLLAYHFPTKDALWIATVEWALDGFLGRIQPNLQALEGLDPATRLRLIMQDFVRFNSTVPQMLEFMITTNKRGGPDLSRLVEDRLRPTYERLRELIEDAQRTGSMPAGDPGLIYYSMIAVASLVFAVRSEFKQLTNRDPLEPDLLEAQVDLLGRLFFPNSDQAG
jgi:AcrR family transcriptional regulator